MIFLLEIPDDVAAAHKNAAACRFILTGNDAEKRSFAGSIRTDNADSITFIDGKRNILQDDVSSI